MAFTPVFIIGAPRSGTTLLRVLLDSHSEIAALPESPWLLGAYGGDCSLRSLLLDLIDGPYGVVRNVAGIAPDHVLTAGRRFLDALFEPFMGRDGKRMLAFKTPDDIPYLDFLTKLAPDAFFIHITRDGRDVCLSQLAKKGSFFQDLKSFGRLSYANVFRRWVEWEQRIRAVLYQPGIRVCHIGYEELVADPRAGLARITAFLGLDFEVGMLDYAAIRHDYPGWEAGSTDVARRAGISPSSVGQWRNARLTTEMRYTLAKYDPFVVSLGYPPSAVASGPLDRVKIALFPLTRPVVDGAWAIWRRVRLDARRRFRRAARAVATGAMAALALYFLFPVARPDEPAQGAACLFTALCFAVAFAPSLAGDGRGPRAYERALVKAGGVMLAYVGLLELGQRLTVGAQGPARFLYDGIGAVIGVGLVAVTAGRAKGRLGRLLRGESAAS